MYTTMTPVSLILISVLLIIAPGSAFILDGQKCVAFPPCSCSGYYVNCDSKSLTTFPKFEVSNLTGSHVRLYLNSNQLTSIPANAFSNLTTSNSTRIVLRLNNNKINSISSNAFAGISDRITELYLNNNNLSQVPSALKSLSTLGYLDLQNNPIASLSSSLDEFHSLRHTLKTLLVDLKGFSVWPSELNILTSLTSLTVRYLNMSHLEFDTFRAFESTLTTLSIQNFQLERIPVAVCHLRNLQSLTFSNNRNIHTNSPLFEPCKPKLTSIRRIDLSGNGLRYMPDVLRNFPTLDRLTIDNNELSYLHWDLVPSNLSLSHLSMNFNNFTRIPSAVRKLKNLSELSMGYNKITSIEDLDLNTLSKLGALSMYYNPLEYISPNAFTHNPDLYYIHFQGTKLHQLPSSLAHLKNLQYLYLYNVPIDCNCDLSFMKALNVSRISMNGNCPSSSIKFKTYLTDDLLYCP